MNSREQYYGDATDEEIVEMTEEYGFEAIHEMGLGATIVTFLRRDKAIKEAEKAEAAS